MRIEHHKLVISLNQHNPVEMPLSFASKDASEGYKQVQFTDNQ
jgi:hypothetical protein